VNNIVSEPKLTQGSVLNQQQSLDIPEQNLEEGIVPKLSNHENTATGRSIKDIQQMCSPISNTGENENTSTQHRETNHNKDAEYSNEFFSKIYKFVEPLVKVVSENRMKMSYLGSLSHGLDAFARVKKLGPNIEKPVGEMSMWWSKALNPLTDILTGFECLAKNNLPEALIRFSLLAKLTVNEPANLGMPLGAYLSDKMTKYTAQNIGIEPHIKTSFSSFGESVKYNIDFYKKFLSEVFNRFKKSDNLMDKLENAAVLYAYPTLAIASAIGTPTIGNQINTPYARLLGFFRNSSGGLCDVTFTLQRIRKMKAWFKKNLGETPTIKDFLKDHQIRFMTFYNIDSFISNIMRFKKDPNTTTILSQFSNANYEIANALSAVHHDDPYAKDLVKSDTADNDKPAPEIKKLTPEGANNIVNYTPNLKPLLELSNNQNKGKSLAQAYNN
jgi:hypothetical protein